MFAEIIRALYTAGIPIAISSYLLAWWALKNNYFEAVDDLKGMEKEFKRLSKSSSKKKSKAVDADRQNGAEEKPKMNPVHNKWLSFGGGFYGVVGLLTYALVELGEIRDFVANFGGLAALISNISVDLLIDFFIDSIMNFVVAIAWPVYWMNEIHGEFIWIWFAIAYLGYWLGMRHAINRARSVGT